ncbi:carbon dioxide concentrating mechanism protein [Laspinema sp. A4]|uniref:carbon dioxide concentrating mechanism protein n=1 Tax=Laspinema sp. D2d TaxID=2953686 RepID=UPI0021BAE510|nr:carbon dioxide concentrating mechanism protein [Laspinema sp. D2d]MCT7985331.1 carbon dioxide concentrating mechanism protein [Laspinema sp. D2d]
MYLPPLQPNRNPNIYMSGDVTIDEGAAIASGVILQASPGTRIEIAAGVCIGMGSILQACQGNLIVEEGATLGSGVLAIGTGKIGTNACIGNSTTLLHPTVASNEVIPPGSLLGDESRHWIDVESTRVAPDPGPASPASPNPVAPDPVPPTPPEPPEPATTSAPEPPTPSPTPEISQPISNQGNGAEPGATPPDQPPVPPSPAYVYGQAHLNRLMQTLFPYKQTPIQPIPED